MTDWLEYWYRALHAEFGIALQTTDPEAVRARLYQARVAANDPALAGLSVILPPNGELWIIRKAIPNVSQE